MGPGLRRDGAWKSGCPKTTAAGTSPAAIRKIAAASVQPVEPHDVVVDDLFLRRRREPGEVLLQGRAGVRPDAVRVWVIGAPDDVVFADQRDDRLEVLVLLVGHEALAAEIVARLHLEPEAARPVVGL